MNIRERGEERKELFFSALFMIVFIMGIMAFCSIV